jgi:hypothetical protein
MSQEQDFSAQSWPKRIACGDLEILIWHHTISGIVGEIDCWTYISQGMSMVGQPELVITLRRRPSEPEHEYSAEPLEWFKMVYAWGTKHRIIDAYHTHEAYSKHWLGSKNLETVTHGIPIDLPGFAVGGLPKNRLHGIALTAEEATIAKAFGYTRVVGHYGISVRWFPYCPWIDRDREDCISMEQMKNGLRGREVPVRKIRALSVRWEGNHIILTIPLGREREVQAAIGRTEPNEVWGFDSCLDPDADSCFYWESGQRETRLYGGW